MTTRLVDWSAWAVTGSRRQGQHAESLSEHHQEQSLGGLNIVHQFEANTHGAATAEGCEQTWSDTFRQMVLVLVARHAPEFGQFVQLLHVLCQFPILVCLTTMQGH